MFHLISTLLSLWFVVAWATPAIRPQSQRGIIFPKESFDDCFLDEARQVPGTCKLMQNCSSALRLWNERRESPKTCFFVKFDHYVCCEADKLDTSTPPLPPEPQAKRSSLRACHDYYNIQPKKEEEVFFGIAAVGGKPTAYHEFPYMAALGWRSNFDESVYYRCGGVLIAPNYVLTAAHCLDFGGEPPSEVRLGGDNLTLSQGDDFKVKRVISHPDYNANSGYNDIALLELDMSGVTPHELTPACLWSSFELVRTDLTAIGYGQTRFAGLASAQLLKVPLQWVSNEQCQPHYPADVLPQGVIRSQLCAGDETRTHDTCQGDSGGPLLMQDGHLPYAVGITSLGQGCASGPPSIYTRVSNYLDWIEGIVWPEPLKNGLTRLSSLDLRVRI